MSPTTAATANMSARTTTVQTHGEFEIELLLGLG
jgi:hypothetical protein